jgi:hypothetical protein
MSGQIWDSFQDHVLKAPWEARESTSWFVDPCQNWREIVNLYLTPNTLYRCKSVAFWSTRGLKNSSAKNQILPVLYRLWHGMATRGFGAGDLLSKTPNGNPGVRSTVVDSLGGYPQIAIMWCSNTIFRIKQRRGLWIQAWHYWLIKIIGDANPDLQLLYVV